MTNFGPVIDGQRFGWWTVVQADAGRDAQRRRLALCRCDCGTERPVPWTSLRAGRSQGCAPGHRSRERSQGRPAPGQAPGQARAAHVMAGLVEAEVARLEAGILEASESIARMRERQAELRAALASLAAPAEREDPAG